MSAKAMSDTAANGETLAQCPACKEMSLHTVGRRGRDDYGEIEGEISWCEKCDYLDEWAARC